MNAASVPEWLTLGAEAVILQPWDRAALRAEPVRVERVLKRDVVLSNGERFPVAYLEKRADAWGATTYLVEPSDPRVEKTRAAIRYSRSRSAALGAVEDYQRSRGVSAHDVAEAWLRLAKFEDQS